MKFNRVPLVAAVVALALSASLVAEETVDLDVVHKIRQEALQNSKVFSGRLK